MEPKLPAPEFTPEQRPGIVTGFESGHENALPTPESDRPVIESERPPLQASPVLPAPVAIPVIPVPSLNPTDDAQVTSSDAPMIAGDDDLIEKEWVDSAKKIIAETRDDPHRREREVGKLQADYLRKRYGKDLGAATE